MPLAKQIIDIPLGGGLEGKVDPKLVQPGSELALENLEFSKPGAVNKRTGYTALTTSTYDGSTITSAKGLFKHINDEVLLADGKYLYAYSDNAAKWVQRDNFYPVSVRADRLISIGNLPGRTLHYTDVAVANDVALMAIVDSTGSYLYLYDISTMTLLTSSLLTTSSYQVRCVASGNTLYAVLATGANLPMYYVNSLAPTAINGPVTIAADAHGTTGTIDVGDMDGAGLAVCAYKTNGSQIKVTTFNTGGGVTASAAVAETPAGKLGLVVTAADDVFVAYRNTANDLSCFARQSNMTSRFAPTVIAAGATYDMPVGVESSTANTVFWVWDGTSGSSTRQIRKAYIDSTGTVTSADILVQRASVATRPFFHNSEMFFGVHYTSQAAGINSTQASSFLVKTNGTTVEPVSIILPNRGITEQAIAANGRLVPSSVYTVSSGKYLFATLGVFENSSLVTTQYPSPVFVWHDFNYRPTSCVFGQNTLLTSGMLMEYDGERVFENNFATSPETVSLAQAAGGSLADGTYQVAVVYMSWDRNGQLAQSAAGTNSITVSAGGGTASITVTVRHLALTCRAGVRIVVYVTEVGGDTFYEVGSTANNTATETSAISITTVASVASNRRLYTTGGVLDNGIPPHLQSITAKGDRAYGVTEDGIVYYTKEYVSGEAASFVQETLIAEAQPDNGRYYAVTAFDDRLFLAGEDSLQVFIGEGIDDTGQSNTLSKPQQVAVDTGVSQYSPMLATHMGIFCKTPRGIALIDRSLQVQLIGAAVDSYKSLTTVSAVLVPKKNQVRFGHSDGSTLVFDYLTQRWSVFTNHTQVGAVVAGDLYYFVTSAGQVYQEASTYADNASSITILEETPWIRVGSIGGPQRVHMLSILGEWKSAHTLTAKIYFDYDSSTIAETVTWDLSSGYSAGQPLQVRHRMGNQCRAIKVRIEDSSQAGTKESCTLAMLSLEVGGKAGIFKLGTAQTA